MPTKKARFRRSTVGCSSARRLKIGDLAVSATSVSLGGEPIGVLPPSEAFTTVSLPLDHKVRDGLNALVFVASGVNEYGLSIAISGVEFDVEKD